MVKNELLKAVSEKVEISRKDVEAVLSAYIDVVTETLAENKDEKVALGNLGAFKVKNVPERTGKIMLGERKGEEYCVPEHDEITFKMSKTAKQLA
ncbi:HU family DNA-binding protein [Konateibacter massiliensis]|uniref:HU family DNA-binding protein n=1 Tax=Konateibacter massiliensis TaxID=2002841 RepID=UPI000C14F7D3|nr:HU family DNA-binding protein [Konateibacter massiliensis]